MDLYNGLNTCLFAFINLKNLRHNINVIRSLIKKGTKILIPVKCNAYGCGIIPVSRFLEKEGSDYLGVAFPFEGILLRRHKIKMPVLIFNEVIDKKDYDNIIRNDLTPTVFTVPSLKIFDQLGRKYNKKINIHIKIDTGMGRIGVPFNEIFQFIELLPSLHNIRVEGIYTHLSSADEKDRRFTLSQIKKFEEVMAWTKQKSMEIPLFHVLNSAGIINYPDFCYNMIRPGIMFYGYFPDNKIKKNVQIKPCMDLKSRILFIKKVEEGTPISYGQTYLARQGEIIASVAGGYGDGINRLLSNNGTVLYHDKLCRVRGRVCMDQFMIDISPAWNARKSDLPNEDLVTIFGKDRKNQIRLELIAEKIKTIPYEILCLIGERVKRVYL